MNWLRDLIDRWRRGPELRAGDLAVVEFKAQRDEAKKAIEDLRVQIGRLAAEMHAERRLFLGLVQSGLLSARCTGGCGCSTWTWGIVVALVDGRRELRPVCRDCARRRVEQQEKAAGDGAVPQAPESTVAVEA